ncbi:MAG: Gfo/Idh/MocA family oxidoreductase [Anaerolineae bacterium]|nr:Gfo/Idh/MocA family oxidoreductase [Anaerolineae bacterium]
MPHTIALVGAGGYGSYYLNELLFNHQDRARLVGVVDPFPERCRYLDELNAAQIPFYPDLQDLFAVQAPDLVCIASPIHLHRPQTIVSLEHGVSVLCEKPLCATIQDSRRMAEAEQRLPGFVAIGYQWSFSAAIQALKRDIMSGELGRPLRLKSRVYWPRTDAYFARNRWAGRIQADDGTWILDSPAHNATAHYLHNMLYVLGPTRETSASLKDVQAELYRANPIENYDTAALRVHTADGVEILFYTTHSTEHNIDPIFDYEFERATVRYDSNQSRDRADIVAHFPDGRTKNYGSPFDNPGGKIWQCVEALDTHAPLPCGIEAATPQLRCLNGAQESPTAIQDFPDSLRRTLHQSDERLIYIEGLEDLLTHCYDTHLLPSESGSTDWAAAGRIIDLSSYDHFPSHPQ